jgi:hypothetical protein
MIAQTRKSSSANAQITIAIIGLVGVLATALVSNWDKLFQDRGVVTARYEGYRPTGNFETELRYFLEVTGNRKLYESLPKQSINAVISQDPRLSQDPKGAEELKEMFEHAMVRFDEVVQAMLPIYSKYFSLTDLQRLNKFYSTEEMQNLVNKQPMLLQEVMPIIAKMTLEKASRQQALPHGALKQN